MLFLYLHKCLHYACFHFSLVDVKDDINYFMNDSELQTSVNALFMLYPLDKI